MAAEAALRWRGEEEGFGRAFALAVGLHLLLVLVFWLLSILDLSREAPAAAGQPVINADLNVSDAEMAAAQDALAYQPPEPVEPQPIPEEEVPPPPQPLPEPIPEQAPVERHVQAQEMIPVPDTENQDEVRRDAISEERREREQEEKRRQEQVDLTERERQKAAEERQRLARQAEAEKQKQEREKKLAQIRAEREKARKDAERAEQKLRQLADARAARASDSAQQDSGSPPQGNNGAAADDGLRAKYAAAIQAAVTSRWTRPENISSAPCRMTITQLPGGEVMSVEISGSCPYDEAGKRSVEAAVLKAQPLPYAGFESVFQRRLNFTFRPN